MSTYTMTINAIKEIANMNTSGNTLTTLVASLTFTLAALSSAASAATLSTSAVIPLTSGGGNFNLYPVTTLDQFDPANGTLTGISFSLEVDNYDVNMFLDGWEDMGISPFMLADLSGQISVDVNLGGGGGLLFSSTVFGDTIFDEFDDVDLSGSSFGAVSQDATASLMNNGVFGDFIGTGQVSIVELAIATFSHPQVVTLEDGSFAEGFQSINTFDLGPSEITIDYTFTPTVVPVPAAAWLFGSALLGLVGVSRKRRG